jgi:outer membrane protein OmpA-like peptidoglycan-associated protein
MAAFARGFSSIRSFRSLATAALLVCAPLLVGCPGTQLKRQLVGIKQTIDQARGNGAYLCAPVELAMAESHYDFSQADLYYGDYFSAKEQVEITDKYAKLAFEKSPAAACKYQEDKPVIIPKVGDRDGDGIKDDADKCPDEPEDKDQFEDEDGCPDIDNDKDGILDFKDKCPNDPEDKDQFEDDDGCPDPDNDKDGVLDVDDKCPLQPGPKENQGCPDTDRDKDGVVDRLDKCPDEPGVAPHGCPEKKFIVITASKIELKKQVHFATNKSKILPDSFELLDEVVEVLQKNPQIKKLRIEGHTDNKGKPAKNVILSKNRAKAVYDYLAGKGIDAGRMESEGFGQTCPIATNTTEEGREKNRRTDFFIVNEGQTIDRGCIEEAAPVKKGKKVKEPKVKDEGAAADDGGGKKKKKKKKKAE